MIVRNTFKLLSYSNWRGSVIQILLLSICWIVLSLARFPQTVVCAQNTRPIEKMTISPDTPLPLPQQEAADQLSQHSVGFFSGFHLGRDLELGISQIVDQVQLLLGDVTINGHVQGDVFVFGGNITVTESARIDGQTNVYLGQIGGTEYLLPDTFNEVNGIQLISRAVDYIQRPERVWYHHTKTPVIWHIVSFTTMLLLHLLIAGIFPTQVGNMEVALVRRPIGNAIIGLLVFLLVPCLIWFAVFSIVGIPVLLLLFAILLPMAIYGKTSLFASIGGSILPNRQSILPAVILGYAIYRLAMSWQILRQITFVLASALGISITIRTLFGFKPPVHLSGRPLQNYNQPTRDQSFRS